MPSQKNITSNPSKPGPNRQRPGSTLSSDALTGLWKSSYSMSHSSGRVGEEIVCSLLPTNPRAFWNATGAALIGGSNEAWRLRVAACGDERLLRLCIAKLKSEVGRPREGAAFSYEQRKMAATARVFFEGACALAQKDKKSDSWLENRLAGLLPIFARIEAADIFDAIGSAASRGRLGAARELMKVFPDKRIDAEDRRQRYGRMGYERGGLGNEASRSQALASLEQSGLGGARQSLERGDQPSSREDHVTNAFFWLGAQARAERGRDPAKSAKWGELAAELAERGVECPMEAAYCCDEVLALLQKRAVEKGLEFEAPSFYTFSRLEILAEAFGRAEAGEVAKICEHDDFLMAAINKQRRSEASTMPAAAVAILAGQEPDPSWAQASVGKKFKVAKAAVSEAMQGKVSKAAWSACDFKKGEVLVTFEALAKKLKDARALRKDQLGELSTDPEVRAAPKARKPRA